MASYRLTAAADEDLDDIALYIARDSLTEAERWLDRGYAQFDALAELPYSSPGRPELGDGLRIRPVGNYNLYYRPIPEGVEMVRVLNAARDIRPEMFS